MKPLVTVGIPFFNNASTLGDAIRAVFVQTLKDWELILVDDGSADGSLRIARSVRDFRVRVLSDGINMGAAFRHNQITELAESPFLAKMDADDLMDPERLEQQVGFLIRNPQIDLVDSAMISLDYHGRPVGKRGLGPLDPRPDGALRHALLNHASVVGRTDWFRKNPYDPGYIRSHDYELWCRSRHALRCSRLEMPLYFVREGRVSVRNYILSGVYSRKALRRHGPAVIGRTGTLKLIVQSHLKDLAYLTFGAVHGQELLVRLRNERLSGTESQLVGETIAVVKRTSVPGLDG